MIPAVVSPISESESPRQPPKLALQQKASIVDERPASSRADSSRGSAQDPPLHSPRPPQATPLPTTVPSPSAPHRAQSAPANAVTSGREQFFKHIPDFSRGSVKNSSRSVQSASEWLGDPATPRVTQQQRPASPRVTHEQRAVMQEAKSVSREDLEQAIQEQAGGRLKVKMPALPSIVLMYQNIISPAPPRTNPAFKLLLTIVGCAIPSCPVHILYFNFNHM